MLRRYFKNQETILVLGLFLLAVIPRILLLNKGPYHYDTVDFLLQMRNGVVSSHGMWVLVPSLLSIGMGYFLHIFLPKTADFTQLFLVSTVCITGLVIVVQYGLFKRLFGKEIALLYAAGISFLPNFFFVSTYGRIDHVLAILFLTLTFYNLLIGRVPWGACFLSLAIASRVENLLVLLSCNLWLFYYVYRESRPAMMRVKFTAAVRKTILFSMLTLGIWLCLGLLVNAHQLINGVFGIEIAEISDNTIGQSRSPLAFCATFLQHLKEANWMTVRLLWPLLLCALFGLGERIKKHEMKPALLFLVTTVISFIYIANRIGDLSRYLILPCLGVLYFSSYGIFGLVHKKWQAAFLAGICILIIFCPQIPILYQRHCHSYQVEFVKYVESITDPGGIILTQDEQIFFSYYTKCQTLQPPSDCREQNWLEFIGKLKTIVAERRPLYFLTTTLSYDQCFYLASLISRNFALQEIGVKKMEGWHKDIYGRRIINEKIFRLQPLAFIP